MTKTELVAELNLLLDDAVGVVVSDTLCPVASKIRFLAEGQDKFCEDTGMFIDITSTAFQIPIVAGTKDYDLDSRIIKVLEVWDGDYQIAPLERPFRYPNPPVSVGTGTIQAWLCDREPGMITFYPTPTQAKTLQMKVWRYPLVSLITGEPELPQRLQRACIEWAAYKILQIHDAELRNKVKAIEHLSNYEQYVWDGKKYLKRITNSDIQFGCDPIYLGV